MTGSHFTSKLAGIGLLVAVIAVLMLAAAGPAYRFGMLELGTSFKLFRWAAYGGMAGGALAILALLAGLRWRGEGVFVRGVLALVLAVVAVGFPWFWLSKARSVPPIHDITTDTGNPPAFVAVLPLREDAPNPAEYGGADIARQQREAYPDLDTQSFPESPASVFEAALAAARGMGWEIVAAEAGAGRIEAVATTTWFGFKDDVVIRVDDRRGTTQVDVRSVSRVGRSDVGANAARIRAFQQALAERLGQGG